MIKVYYIREIWTWNVNKDFRHGNGMAKFNLFRLSTAINSNESCCFVNGHRVRYFCFWRNIPEGYTCLGNSAKLSSEEYNYSIPVINLVQDSISLVNGRTEVFFCVSCTGVPYGSCEIGFILVGNCALNPRHGNLDRRLEGHAHSTWTERPYPCVAYMHVKINLPRDWHFCSAVEINLLLLLT